jgi:uncharacterized phosphosugar-binding protein
MKPGQDYFLRIREKLTEIQDSEEQKIDAAARLLVHQIESDKLIYVFGVGGHSFVGSEEFFYRAGGLANISPIFDLSLGLFAGGQKSTMLERTEDYGTKVIQSYRLQPDDVLIITSLYGINACTIDAALEAKRVGCKTIGISSVPFSENTPRDFHARSGKAKNLQEIVDIHIDNHIPPQEGLVEIEGCTQFVGTGSTILQNFCINWLVVETINICIEQNIEPPIWMSANVKGGDEKNKAYLERYTPIIKML